MEELYDRGRHNTGKGRILPVFMSTLKEEVAFRKQIDSARGSNRREMLEKCVSIFKHKVLVGKNA